MITFDFCDLTSEDSLDAFDIDYVVSICFPDVLKHDRSRNCQTSWRISVDPKHKSLFCFKNNS